MAKFTTPFLFKLWKEGRRFSYTDDECQGLKFNVTARKAANFSYRYQLKGERQEPGLGSFPELGLAEARAKANAMRKQVRIDKIDPLQRRKSEQSKAAADAAKDITVGELWEKFDDDKYNRCKDWNRRSAGNNRTLMHKYALPIQLSNVPGRPRFKDLLARDVDTPLLREMLEPIAKRKIGQAYSVQNLLGQLFDYAAHYNYGDRRNMPNPARGILKYMGAKRENGHRRAYPYERMPELIALLREFQKPRPYAYQPGPDRAAIIAARANGMSIPKLAQKFEVPQSTVWRICKTGEIRPIDRYTVVTAYALEALILTGPPRSCEVIDTQWAEFNCDQETVVMLRSRMKIKKGRDDQPHIVPLTKRVLEIFRIMKTMKCGDYIFPGSTRGRTPKSRGIFSAEHPGVAGVPLGRNALLRLLRDKMGVSDTDVHGFRKTFKNWARNRGFDPELIERSLDHAYGSQIERVYQDDQLVERRCEMLEAWADYCNGSPAEIIRLPVRRRKAG
jgi:integrase